MKNRITAKNNCEAGGKQQRGCMEAVACIKIKGSIAAGTEIV